MGLGKNLDWHRLLPGHKKTQGTLGHWGIVNERTNSWAISENKQKKRDRGNQKY